MVMALIYSMVGEYEKAIEQLEYLMTIEAWCSAEYIEVEPYFEPLRKFTRFQNLITKYKKN